MMRVKKDADDSGRRIVRGAHSDPWIQERARGLRVVVGGILVESEEEREDDNGSTIHCASTGRSGCVQTQSRPLESLNGSSASINGNIAAKWSSVGLQTEAAFTTS
eukprot:13638-Rhodomonas_salina.3